MSSETQSKECTRCKEVLPLTSFHGKRKLASKCKQCVSNERYLKKGGPDPKTQLRLAGLRKCTKCKKTKQADEFNLVRKGQDRRQSKCKECSYADKADWAKRNKDHLKSYADANRETIRANGRKQRQRMKKEDPEKLKARDKKGNSTPAARERARKNAKVQKAIRRGVPYTAEALDYIEILKGDPCGFCGEPYQATEHIISIKRGGTGEWDNLSAVCTSCNSQKSAKHLLHFMLDRL